MYQPNQKCPVALNPNALQWCESPWNTCLTFPLSCLQATQADLNRSACHCSENVSKRFCWTVTELRAKNPGGQRVDWMQWGKRLCWHPTSTETAASERQSVCRIIYSTSSCIITTVKDVHRKDLNTGKLTFCSFSFA